MSKFSSYFSIWTHAFINFTLPTTEKSPSCSDKFIGNAPILSFPHLSAGGAEAVLICADAVPTESADLVATGAGKEVDVIYLQRLHAQRALHGVVLHFRAVGHPMAWQG